jgi:Putative prokaryotic signal transducing protein
MDEANLIMVQSFATKPEADMALSLLRSADIDAIVRSEGLDGIWPHVAWSSGGFKIFVREEDVDDARELLETPAGI